MNEQVLDLYKILGTSRSALTYSGFSMKKRNDVEINDFIKDKYFTALRTIEISKVNASPEKIKELEEQAKLVEYAYRKLRTPYLRDQYHSQLDELKKENENNSTNAIPEQKNAYDVLNTTRDAINNRSDADNDLFLEERKNKLISKYEAMIIISNSFSEKEKISLKIKEIEENYQLIKNAQCRKKYDETLKIMEERRNRIKRKENIRLKFSHLREFMPTLIDYKTEDVNHITREKNIVKKHEESPEYKYLNNNNQEIRIKQISKVSFMNWEKMIDHLNEYEITRNVDGREKRDRIYTPSISFFELSNQGSDYYNCVINELLSEDFIEGSKYNAGYIGSVDKNKEGKYITTLDKTNLKGRDKEMLTAVMLLRNMEKRKEKNSKGGEKEHE